MLYKIYFYEIFHLCEKKISSYIPTYTLRENIFKTMFIV